LSGGFFEFFQHPRNSDVSNCPKCGVDVPEGAGFCHKCGAPLDGSVGVTAPGVERFHESVANRRGVVDTPEEEVWQGSYSPKALLGTAVMLGVLSITAIGVAFVLPVPIAPYVAAGLVLLAWALLGLCVLYRRMSVHYRLTNHRFFHEHGILSRVADRIELIDVDDITVSQGLFERMFGVGTLKITSSDRTSPELVIPGIAEVRDVATRLDSLRRADRMRRGLSIESI
jgi:membrane protein YdbS with pleckstrin-like domain